MQTAVEIAGNEMLVDFDIKITSRGCPASEPSYSSGGEPAEPCEFDVEIIELRFPKQHADVEIYLPKWLKDLLTTHLLERDDIYAVADEIAHEDSRDPDEEYERMRDEAP